MGLQPNIQKHKKFLFQQCSRCGNSFGEENFAWTNSLFYPNGCLPICNDCVNKLIEENGGGWGIVDKLCQLADIPFIPSEWEKVREENSFNAFYIYSQIFKEYEYDHNLEDLNWKSYYDAYKVLHERGQLEDELPLLGEDKKKALQKKWGHSYDDEQLEYLENLLNGLLTTQNVNGKLQLDQAYKICKMSLEIDSRIEAGEDFDKLLGSYDKLVKSAEFTPQNVKNINDFDTTGELVRWCEKRGWKNDYYDNVTRDVVDETIKNVQLYNKRLYVNEVNIGDEITRRLKAIENTAKLENNYYGTDQENDLDNYETQAYDVGNAVIEEEDFKVEEDDEE